MERGLAFIYGRGGVVFGDVRDGLARGGYMAFGDKSGIGRRGDIGALGRADTVGDPAAPLFDAIRELDAQPRGAVDTDL